MLLSECDNFANGVLSENISIHLNAGFEAMCNSVVIRYPYPPLVWMQPNVLAPEVALPLNRTKKINVNR